MSGVFVRIRAYGHSKGSTAQRDNQPAKDKNVKIPFLSSKDETATDPVCVMTVDTSNPGGGVSTHNGEVYYFCGPGCRVAFEKDPEGYLSGEKSVEM